jgi:hypothetical protein
MNSLLSLLVIVAGVATTGVTPSDPHLEVNLQLYSGRPNPIPWRITDMTRIEKIRNAISNEPPLALVWSNGCLPGVQIRNVGVPNFPDEIWICPGVVTIRQHATTRTLLDRQQIAQFLVSEETEKSLSKDAHTYLTKQIEVAQLASEPTMILDARVSDQKRIDALEILAVVDIPKGAEVAKELLGQSPVPAVQRAAITVLRLRGKRDDLPLLRALAKSANAGVKREVESAIAAIESRAPKN